MAEDRMGVLELSARRPPRATPTSCARACGCSPRRSWRPRSARVTGRPRASGPGAPADRAQRLSRAALGHPRRDIDLAIPRVRDGSYFPSLLEPRRRAERALLAVVQEAYVLGVSTRRVEDLVDALGIALAVTGARCAGSAPRSMPRSRRFRYRSLARRALSLPLPRRDLRQGPRPGRVVSMAGLVAIGVARDLAETPGPAKRATFPDE